MSDIVVTTDEANRLAAGLTGAARAEREATGRVEIGSADVHVDGAVAARVRAYTPGGTSGWVKIGPLAIHGTWDDLGSFFATGLSAVREQSTGPVGA